MNIKAVAVMKVILCFATVFLGTATIAGTFGKFVPNPVPNDAVLLLCFGTVLVGLGSFAIGVFAEREARS